MLWLCFGLPACLFGNTRDTSVMHEKAKIVCFIHMKPQKMKFKSVQINRSRTANHPISQRISNTEPIVQGPIIETHPLTGYCNTFILLKLRVYVNKFLLLAKNWMLDKHNCRHVSMATTKKFDFLVLAPLF